MPADHDTRPLGRTGIDVLPLGIGTNKWRRAADADSPAKTDDARLLWEVDTARDARLRSLHASPNLDLSGDI
jgi:hypothetical protein